MEHSPISDTSVLHTRSAICSRFTLSSFAVSFSSRLRTIAQSLSIPSSINGSSITRTKSPSYTFHRRLSLPPKDGWRCASMVVLIDHILWYTHPRLVVTPSTLVAWHGIILSASTVSPLQDTPSRVHTVQHQHYCWAGLLSLISSVHSLR